MAKVTAANLKPVHVRAARGMLNMSTRELAEAMGSPVTMSKLRNLENGLNVHEKVRVALVEGFERFGLTLKNGTKPGVTVSNERAWKAARIPDATQR